MNEEDVIVEEAIRALTDEVSLRDLLDEMITELRELRAQMNRIEARLNPQQNQWSQIYYTGTSSLNIS